MLMTEWNWDDALAVRYEEGMEKGLSQGLSLGMEEGREEVLNLLKSGKSPEEIIREYDAPDARYP